MKLTSYTDTKALLSKGKDKLDSATYSKLTQLLDKIKQFNDKHKIDCSYGLAVPSEKQDKTDKADKTSKAIGINLGKVTMPKTLIKFLQGKAGENAQAAKSLQKLYAMLLKHQQFNVAINKRQLRILVD